MTLWNQLTNQPPIKLEITSFPEAPILFQKMGEIKVDSAPISYRGASPQKPSPPRYEPITFERGIVNSPAVTAWLAESSTGKMTRRTVTVSVLQADGTTYKSAMRLSEAWPQKWQGQQTDDQALQIDSLTLVFEQIEQMG